jgi:tRNA (cytosine34-C5)-methyltransferase
MDDMENNSKGEKQALDPSLPKSQANNPKSGSNKSKKRWTRAQRRKQQLINENPDRDPRVIIKENENLVNYYKQQNFFKSDAEFEEFLLSLQSSLPASFRINTFDYKQAQLLLRLIQSQFQEFLETKNDDSSVAQNDLQPNENLSNATQGVAVSSDVDSVPTFDCLEWYPKKMAWQMNFSRVDFRKSSVLRSLHKFIQAETDNGFVSRQEAVSMIPPLVLDIKRGQKILDMCAAPGSKTAQLLEYLAFDIHSDKEEIGAATFGQEDGQISFDDGLVVANDIDNKRCYMLVHQAGRLNSPNCVITNEDASRMPEMKTFIKDSDEPVKMKFDRILCDAPCTGDGTIRKNPDVWRKWSVGNANNFHGLQSKILKRGVELLQKDGLIVYSTCSMNPVEDEAVVANILRLGQGTLVLEDCSHKLKGLKYIAGLSSWTVMDSSMRKLNGPEDVKPEQVTQLHKSLFSPSTDEAKQFNLHRCIRLFPHLQNTGAFFVAVIRKLSEKLPFEAKEKNEDSVDKNTSEDRQRHQPKRRRYGFKEDPFIFLESSDGDWKAIKEFYGLPHNFPVHQLTHKCKSGKKRSIYLVSNQTRDFIMANQELPDRNEFVKVVNGGKRLFVKAETESGFRICQDGIYEILPFIDSNLKVPIIKDDLILLLAHKTVLFSELSASKYLSEKLRVGSCVLIYKHPDNSNGDSAASQQVVEMPLVAWRGEKSLALYVSNTYKVHLRSLIHGRIVSEDAVSDCAGGDTKQLENNDNEE